MTAQADRHGAGLADGSTACLVNLLVSRSFLHDRGPRCSLLPECRADVGQRSAPSSPCRLQIQLAPGTKGGSPLAAAH